VRIAKQNWAREAFLIFQTPEAKATKTAAIILPIILS
jgi:hypothetical protein